MTIHTMIALSMLAGAMLAVTAEWVRRRARIRPHAPGIMGRVLSVSALYCVALAIMWRRGFLGEPGFQMYGVDMVMLSALMGSVGVVLAQYIYREVRVYHRQAVATFRGRLISNFIVLSVLFGVLELYVWYIRFVEVLE